MIHLDTNVLIGAAVRGSPWAGQLEAWLVAGEKFAASAIVWAEFLNGPLSPPQVRVASQLLEGRIVPFGLLEAELSAKLFNGIGRKRGTLPDCFIAASAIRSGAPLATQNRRDFLPFTSAGLRLA
jgi:predicted nucleic acid-binding protein